MFKKLLCKHDYEIVHTISGKDFSLFNEPHAPVNLLECKLCSKRSESHECSEDSDLKLDSKELKAWRKGGSLCLISDMT